MMSIDVNVMSSQLLEKLANSIYDRNTSDTQFSFTIKEIHIVEEWIKEMMKLGLELTAHY